MSCFPGLAPKSEPPTPASAVESPCINLIGEVRIEPMATKRKKNGASNGPKPRSQNKPPPSPPGDGSPLSREYWRRRAAEIPILKVRIADLEAALAERVSDDAEGITASRMKKVLNQRPEADSGPLEERIREWLSKDVKGFEASIEEKERKVRGDAERDAELVMLRAKVKDEKVTSLGPDEGTAAAFGVIDKLLADFKAGDR